MFNLSAYILDICHFLKVIYKKINFNKNIFKILLNLTNRYYLYIGRNHNDKMV